MPTLNPYIGFRDNAREAMTFYKSVFGGELNLSTFGDFGGSDDPSESELVMHGQLNAPNGFTLMGADTPASLPYSPGGPIAISLSGSNDEEAELRGYWERLSEGAEIQEPLAQAPWGDHFGMLTDRFGVRWMVNIAGAPQA